MPDYFAPFRCAPADPPAHSGDRPAAGITLLIPTYSPPEGERVAGLRRCLTSVRRAARTAGGVPVAALVVDNGLSARGAREVTAALESTRWPYRIVRAPGGGNDRRYTAALARNAGLSVLAGLPPTSPLRRRRLLFLDDDTALAPGALVPLMSTLDEVPAAVAACPRVVPVPGVRDWLARAEARTPRTVAPRRLPGALRGARCDLLSVTSHGSLVTGRTVGLLVRLDPVLAWTGRHGPLFYEGTPYGSSEDMLAMAMLSRIGQLWAVPAAEVADEARATPGATRAQQFAWGYDHAWLAATLARAGLLATGVQALDWALAGWESARANWGPVTGFIINPVELGLGHRLLRATVADPTVAGELFGAHADKVAAGAGLLGRVLARWRGTGVTASRTPRPDLPPLGARDWASMRDGIDALIGHLAGNVAGSLDNGGDPGSVPPFFLYGARQPAAAARGCSPLPRNSVCGLPVLAKCRSGASAGQVPNPCSTDRS